MNKSVILEVIATNVTEARAAEKGGANRLELIDNYPAGGTTPALAVIESVKSAVKIPIQVMIRPRAGNFVHSVTELKLMEEQVHRVRKIGVAGIVFGVLMRNGLINIKAAQRIIESAKGMSITFHAAFDETSDRLAALETLIKLGGIDRILTMALYNDSARARHQVKELVSLGQGKISIMPAISPKNVRSIKEIAQETGVTELHFGRAVRTPHQYTGKIDIQRLRQIRALLEN